jgi:hypothetical protein
MIGNPVKAAYHCNHQRARQIRATLAFLEQLRIQSLGRHRNFQMQVVAMIFAAIL